MEESETKSIELSVTNINSHTPYKQKRKKGKEKKLEAPEVEEIKDIYLEIAKSSIDIYNKYGYAEMHKYLNKPGSADCLKSEDYFKKIYKGIVWHQENVNIFIHELLRICDNEEANKEEVIKFFNQFNFKWKLHLVTALLEHETAEPISTERINFLCEMVLNIAKSINDLKFTSALCKRIRAHKEHIMREDFKELCASKNKEGAFCTMIQDPLYCVLKQLSTMLYDYSTRSYPQVFKQIIGDLLSESSSSNDKKTQALMQQKDLSELDRFNMAKYMITSFFVMTPHVITLDNINKKLSFIYSNDYTPISKLGYAKLSQRIVDLFKLLHYFEDTKPKTFMRASNANSAHALKPIAKSIYYLKELMAKCISTKICYELIENKADVVKEDLKYVIEDLRDSFFKKILLKLNGSLGDLIKKMMKSDLKAPARTMVDTLASSFKRLKIDTKLRPSSLKQMDEICKNMHEICDSLKAKSPMLSK